MCQLLAGRKPTEIRVASRQEALQGFPQIDQKVPAVDNLASLWSTLAGTPRILRRTVAHNNLNTGVVIQPGGEGVGSAIRQKVNRTTSGKINQNAAVDPALAEGKIVHAKNFWATDGWGRGGAKDTDTG